MTEAIENDGPMSRSLPVHNDTPPLSSATTTTDDKEITPTSVDVLSHKLRSRVDAILIGKNTFRIDKPTLNVRLVEGKNPDRIVLD